VDTVSDRLRATQAKLDVVSPLIKRQVGELVVAQSVTQVLGIGGGDDIIVVGEVLDHLHEVITRSGLNLVLRQPVEEFLLIVSTVVQILGDRHGHSGGEHGSNDSRTHF